MAFPVLTWANANPTTSDSNVGNPDVSTGEGDCSFNIGVSGLDMGYVRNDRQAA